MITALVKLSYGWMKSISDGRTPAMPNASRPETTPGLTVRSGICEMCQ
jgi:hypothetical protein